MVSHQVQDQLTLLAALKYIKACLKSNNHFMHRYVVKNDLILPVLELLKMEGARDNMLTSACMDVFDMIRAVSGLRCS
jgi:protein phosphatase-4 regulatory subunit 3